MNKRNQIEDQGGVMDKKLKDRIYGYFVKVHGAFEYRRGWLRIPTCPFCASEEKYGVHLAKNRTNCFRCGYSKPPIKSVMDIEGVKTMKELISIINKYDSYHYKPPKVEIIPETEVILPEGYMNIRRGEDGIGRRARKYMRGRGFDIEEIGRKGFGYVVGEENPLYGYIIIPFTSNKRVIYYQTRSYFGDGPRFKNPNYEDFGIGKSQVIYNVDCLRWAKEISISEAAFNAATMGKTGTSISGKALSAKQLTIYLQSKVELINILLDDEAWSYALRMADALINYKRVRIIRFPDERDVNDWGRQAVSIMIDEAPVLSNFKELTRFKNGSDIN